MTGAGSHLHLRVLVVEDETLIRWSIAETLAQKGHTVIEAGSAATAVQALADTAEPIDVVMLDLRLPDSNGLGSLDDIWRRSPDSAIVIMTAYGTPEITKGALDRGVYRVLNKPFDVHALEPLVIEAYRSRSIVSSPNS